MAGPGTCGETEEMLDIIDRSGGLEGGGGCPGSINYIIQWSAYTCLGWQNYHVPQYSIDLYDGSE